VRVALTAAFAQLQRDPQTLLRMLAREHDWPGAVLRRHVAELADVQHAGVAAIRAELEDDGGSSRPTLSSLSETRNSPRSHGAGSTVRQRTTPCTAGAERREAEHAGGALARLGGHDRVRMEAVADNLPRQTFVQPTQAVRLLTDMLALLTRGRGVAVIRL